MSDIRIPEWQSRGRGFGSHILQGSVFDPVTNPGIRLHGTPKS